MIKTLSLYNQPHFKDHGKWDKGHRTREEGGGVRLKKFSKFAVSIYNAPIITWLSYYNAAFRCHC